MLLDVFVMILVAFYKMQDRRLPPSFLGSRQLLDLKVYATWSTAVWTVPSAREEKDFVEKLARWFVKIFEEGVDADPNVFEEKDPPFTSLSLLFLCLLCRALQTSRFSSSEQSHDTVSDLRGTILKLGGICEDTCKVSNFISFMTDKSISRESESDI